MKIIEKKLPVKEKIMKVIEKTIVKQTLESFADEHNLVLEIIRDEDKFYHVNFSYVEVAKDGILISYVGRGSTKKEAINDYIRKIEENMLRIGGRRKEIRIWCPELKRK